MHSHHLLHEDPAGGQATDITLSSFLAGSCTYTLDGYPQDTFFVIQVSLGAEDNYSDAEQMMVLPDGWFYIWPSRAYLVNPETDKAFGPNSLWIGGFQDTAPKVIYATGACAQYRIFPLANVDRRQPVDYMLAQATDRKSSGSYTATNFTSLRFQVGRWISPTRHHFEGAVQFTSWGEIKASSSFSLSAPDVFTYTMRGPEADLSLNWWMRVRITSGVHYWRYMMTCVDRVRFNQNTDLFETGTTTLGYTPMQTWGKVGPDLEFDPRYDSSYPFAVDYDLTYTNTPVSQMGLFKSVYLDEPGRYVWGVGICQEHSAPFVSLRVNGPAGQAARQDVFQDFIGFMTGSMLRKRVAYDHNAQSATPRERGFYGYEFSLSETGTFVFSIDILDDSFSHTAFLWSKQTLEFTTAMLGKANEFVFFKQPNVIERWGPGRYMVNTSERMAGEDPLTLSATMIGDAFGTAHLVFSVTPRNETGSFAAARQAPVGYPYNCYNPHTGMVAAESIYGMDSSTAGGRAQLDRWMLPWRYESNTSTTPIRGKYYAEAHSWGGNNGDTFGVGFQLAARGHDVHAFPSRMSHVIMGSIIYEDDDWQNLSYTGMSLSVATASVCWRFLVNYSAGRAELYREASLIVAWVMQGDGFNTPSTLTTFDKTFGRRQRWRFNTTGPFDYPKPAGFVAFDWQNEVSA